MVCTITQPVHALQVASVLVHVCRSRFIAPDSSLDRESDPPLDQSKWERAKSVANPLLLASTFFVYSSRTPHVSFVCSLSVLRPFLLSPSSELHRPPPTSTSSRGCQVLQQVRCMHRHVHPARRRWDDPTPKLHARSLCLRETRACVRSEKKGGERGEREEEGRWSGKTGRMKTTRVVPCTWPIYPMRLRTVGYVALSIGLDPWPQPGTTYYLLGHLNHPPVPPRTSATRLPADDPSRSRFATLPPTLPHWRKVATDTLDSPLWTSGRV